MNGLQGVGPVGEEGNDGQGQGEDILHQIQRGRTLDVVDDSSSLTHNAGHGGKIVVQQHQAGHLAGGLGAGGHGDGAVGLLHGEDIVDTVAGHGHDVARLLEGLDEFFLLVRGHPAKDRVIFHRFGKVLIGFQGSGIHPSVCIFDACPHGHIGNGSGIVAGDDPDGHPLIPEIGEGLIRLRSDLIGQQDQGQRCQQPLPELTRHRVVLIAGDQQHPIANRGPPGYGFLDLFESAAHDKFRCAGKECALLLKYGAAPLGGGGEGDMLSDVPVRLIVKEGDHGPVGVVFRLPAVIHGSQDLLQTLGVILRQGDHVLHFHFRLGDGTGLVHAQHIHPCQGLDTVHILDQHFIL